MGSTSNFEMRTAVEVAEQTAGIDATLRRLGRSRFRAQFHLRQRELSYAERRSPSIIEQHAREFVGERLSPASPKNDGKQTPWGGHPVFRAQHATATCCRGCLAKHHDVPRGRALTRREQDYVVAVIMRWIGLEMTERPQNSHTVAGAGSASSRAAASTVPTLF